MLYNSFFPHWKNVQSVTYLLILAVKSFSLYCVLALLIGSYIATSALATELNWRHGYPSQGGALKYSEGFSHFDYVNIDAPQGGAVILESSSPFTSINPVPAQGVNGLGSGLVYETLLRNSMDEVNSYYGLLAEKFYFPEDFSYAVFRLDPRAKWHDGRPVTPEDVIFSFNAFIEHNPQVAFYYKHVTSAEKIGPRDVKFLFDQKGNKELPVILGQLSILPKHWWEGTDDAGKKRDIAKPSLEKPLGSGPYQLTSIKPGADLIYQKVDTYWGNDHPFGKGHNNFKTLHYKFFKDRGVAFEAFKAGNIEWWRENKAKRWMKEYDFHAVKSGQVKKEEFEHPYRRGGQLVGLIPNLRLDKFKDARVRKALYYAFDFESMNKDLFFKLYERTTSFFHGLEFASTGLPFGDELDFLKEAQAVSPKDVPGDVFTKPFEPPLFTSARAERKHLGTAVKLLRDAGWSMKNGQMINRKTKAAFEIEVLMNGKVLEKVLLHYQQTLKKIGIRLKLRVVDASQYTERVRKRDFEMIYSGWGQSTSPGNEQLDFFSIAAADQPSSRNYGGIKNKAVDFLIDKMIKAKDREELIAATRAMDRILLAKYYVVPSYNYRKTNIAWWNKFSHNSKLPHYDVGFPDIWWYDKEKADKLN